MEINVSDVSTSIRAADASTLLTPQILERIVAIVVQRVFEEHEKQARIKAERSLEQTSSERR
jgi:hypothetical protein